ncbi:MAG: hypothetical protein WAX80_02865 [Minisyncoccia bacterium]
MKIVSKGRVLNSAEFYKKKQRRKYVYISLLLIGCLLFISFLVYISRLGRFQITEVVVSGENIIDRDLIISAVKRSLSGHYLWLIPKSNVLLYPKDATIDNLFKEFPRFKSVGLDLNGLNIITVTVEERTPFALYCINAPECYFLDEDGLIFAIAPSFSGAVYFIYTTEEPLENPMGKSLLVSDQFRALSKFIESLTPFGVHPIALGISNEDYSLILSGDRQIMWRRDSDFARVHSNLEAFLSDDTIRAQPDFLERILYIDLRTEDKVRWKFKD